MNDLSWNDILKKFHESFEFFSGFTYIMNKKMIKTDPFWERVKSQIRAHKTTQKKFAEYVGINPYTFKGWLRFNRIPDAYTVYDISLALGVSMEYLMGGEDGQAVKKREKDTVSRKTAAADIRKMVKRIERKVELIG